MSKKKSYASRAKGDIQFDESEFSMDSDELSCELDYMSRPSKQSHFKNDAAGERKVRCRYCLKVKTQLRTIKKHVKRHHTNFYKGNEKRERTFFVAAEGQTIADDSAYRASKDIMSSAIQSIEAPSVVKRQKKEDNDEGEEYLEFEQILNKEFESDEPGLS